MAAPAGIKAAFVVGLLLGASVAAPVADVCIIGAGIGGLSCGAVLSATYGLNVHVFESHYEAGGCAHSFSIPSESATFRFDAGPTIVAGCTGAARSPLAQVLAGVGATREVDWIDYDAWGMVDENGPWRFQLGEGSFEEGPLRRFGGADAVREFRALREACAPLCQGAAEIPTMALRGDQFRILPLLNHLSALQKVAPYADTLDGSFRDLMDEHVRDGWLRDWLDALAFSLSALPAADTGAAAMAYTLYDLHSAGAKLNYPRGGMGRIAEVLADVIRSGGGRVSLSSPVADILVEGGKACGIRLRNGEVHRSSKGVVCNANSWALGDLLGDARKRRELSAEAVAFLDGAARPNATDSFLHLHLGMDLRGLDMDRREAHYTVMHKGLHRVPGAPDSPADPCGKRNMVAVSNPSKLDGSLADRDGFGIVHAYGAGNEPFAPWDRPGAGAARGSRAAYAARKEEAAEYLFESVGAALDLDVAEVKARAEVQMIGTPLTHQRFLRRHEGTYGPTFESTLGGPVTPVPKLFLAGDSTFPGIGVPAVAVSGASAANTIVNPLTHLAAVLKGP